MSETVVRIQLFRVKELSDHEQYEYVIERFINGSVIIDFTGHADIIMPMARRVVEYIKGYALYNKDMKVEVEFSSSNIVFYGGQPPILRIALREFEMTEFWRYFVYYYKEYVVDKKSQIQS